MLKKTDSKRISAKGYFIVCLILPVLLLLPKAHARDGEFVGSETCESCHEDTVKDFASNIHNRVKEWEIAGEVPQWGCESCHGPGGDHADSGGEIDKIAAPSDIPADESSRVCLQCHGSGSQMFWTSSLHMQNQVSCSNCHSPHTNESPEAACFRCHVDKKAQMRMPSHHPIAEGKMTCASCHDPHGIEPGNLTEGTINELCSNCHADKEGPFAFEHDPVSENCTYCHDPHGTVANNLRKQNEPFLCLQCHSSHEDAHHEAYTLAAWRTSFFTKCTECHAQIHGSDFPSLSGQGRLSR